MSGVDLVFGSAILCMVIVSALSFTHKIPGGLALGIGSLLMAAGLWYFVYGIDWGGSQGGSRLKRRIRRVLVGV